MNARTHSRSTRLEEARAAIERAAATCPPEDRAGLDTARAAIVAARYWCVTDDAAALARGIAHALDGPERYSAPIESWILDLNPTGFRP